MRVWIGIAALTLALATGCGDEDNGNGGSTSGTTEQTGGGTQETVIGDGCEGVAPAATVSISDNGFDRREVDIASGSTVRWVNNGSDDHSIWSGEPDHSDAGSLFQSGVLAPGDSFCFTFASSSDVDFFCGEHTNEQGEVEVDGDDNDDRDDDDDDRDDDDDEEDES